MIKFIKRIGSAVFSIVRKRAFLATVMALVTVLMLLTAATTASTVTIIDGTDVKIIKTLSTDAKVILDAAGVELGEDDSFTALSLETSSGSIRLHRAFDVHVSYGNEKLVARIGKGTVADVLNKLDITVGEHDIISAQLSDEVSAGMFIDIISVDYDTYTEEQTIEPETETIYSADLLEGVTQVSDGVPGVKQITYKNKLVEGVVIDTDVVNETVIIEPVNTVKTVGTKSETVSASVSTTPPAEGAKWYTDIDTVSTLLPEYDFELDENNRPVNYKRLITGKATAYSGGGLTATGKGVRPGYIAVNPKQIPYGSKLYIITPDGSYIYGYCSAEDTGGFASYGRITTDLYFPSHGACTAFGVRNVEIYVLD